MTASFAQRCGIHDAAREDALQRAEQAIAAGGLELVRFAWCDLHGVTRGKTLVASAAAQAMRDGLGMVSTLMLKDTSDRTAFKVFEPGGTASLPGFGFANNLLLLADPASLRTLPWTPATGWVRAQPWFEDATPVELDTRRVLERALERLAGRGWGLRCGLEVEFHIYRITDAGDQLDPAQAAWPGLPPRVELVHPGYNLLAENWYDMAEEPLRIVQHTAQALGLPLLSLEIELGPSQVEAVFQATDAMTAADNMVLFRNGVRQALRRAGYHASFMCRPPFPNIMSSGWHLHQSLVALDGGANLFRREQPEPGATPAQARHTLSALGEHYLAGLLEHARGMAVFCTPTVNGFGRFRPNALAPQAVLWGRDNRGAMLRVVGACGDAGTRIENRIGEPAANPYLYLASQIHAGLDGIERRREAPPATEAPYATGGVMLPTGLGEALAALRQDEGLVAAFGAPFIDYFSRIKQCELQRWEAAEDKDDFQRREYFSRF
ncbi:glutamine synthetase family protein [Ramlibacter tataouinensis]|uniref:Glutamine synthetase (Glutamate--ammonia ligase)-like protein n=1 Tax=Ramlibacter tataouinensis (strain ATCC BAA-407 / DSM 14655 / LMG 21543 / TTB310) TaxID=365046 RepID=F5XWD5_RAMTT|nr:glutamine synthetase family protein [Ramlibacter tataouinensis]AEG92889.1 glutamine synthetase (Glutamate--ammonia ligase)-like protein [Ramlibacter tataouinensis TTB310]